MIKDLKHAMKVQARRRAAGKRGRSKAVRRWFASISDTPGIDTDPHVSGLLPANFKGCKGFDEVHEND